MSPDSSRVRALVVEDDKALSDLLCAELRARGHLAVAAETVADGLAQLRQLDFDVALCDLALSDGRGMEVLARIAEEAPPTEAIVLTGFATVGEALEAMRRGAYDYLTKPPRMEELGILVEKAAEKSRLRRESSLLRRRLDGGAAAEEEIATEDPAMRDVLATIARVAPSDVPVLLEGESGTGKELVARTLHRLSPRAAEPFVAMSCGGVPEDRLESELFGHRSRPGLFEAADRGTLFLHEAGQIAGPVQVKLLRAIETRTILRVGGTRPMRADVRLVAASRSTRTEMGDAVTVKLPPLRERRGDVPLLARHFLERLAPRKKLTPRALEVLQGYGWPGNVRELAMVIERAALLAAADTIDAADLPLDVRDQSWKSAAVRASLSLAEMEREYIETVLRQHDGHRGKTARALGIDPKTLYNKLGPERPRKKADAAGPR